MNSNASLRTLWAGLALSTLLVLQAADPSSSGESVTLVKAGSVWHYLNDGTDQGEAWRTAELDATVWRSGPAQLGYGDGDEATITRAGRPPHPLTAYFRTEFSVEDAGAFRQLVVRLVRDDGAVVYLNGRELLRDNLPVGEIGFDTPATGNAADENSWRTFETDTALLVTGRNVLAVEVHQANAESSDMSFDLELGGRPGGSAVPVVSITAVDPEAREFSPMLPAFDNARFRLERTGAAAGELTVFFAVGGTAEPGVDYQALGESAVFKGGERTTDLEVVVIDDQLLEGDESVVLSLQPDPSMGPLERYRVNPERAEARAVIHDNETSPARPRVEITRPPDGAQFPSGGVIRIEAVAVDPQGFIARLEYFANGTPIGESSVGWPECVGCEPKPGDPAKHVFEWKDAAAGGYELVAKATHRLVFRPEYQEQPLDPPAVSPPVRIKVGAAPPSARVRIVTTRPVAEESSFPYRRLPLTGEFTLSRTGDLTQPASVFVHYEGGAENGVDCEPLPWQVTIPAGESAVSLEVKAIPDKALEGAEKLLARLAPCPPKTEPPLGVPCVEVEIDPEFAAAVVTICDDARCGEVATLRITAPRDGARFPVGGPIQINALAIDPLGAITRVEFWAGERPIGVSEIWFIRAPDPGTPIHHEFVWKDAAPGAHTLTARAKDSAGLDVVSSPVAIQVGELFPLRVTIVKPLSGAVFAPDDTVEIRAVAMATGGAVTELSIYGDGQLLGSAKEAELTVRWEKPPVGVHVLTAQAIAENGQQAVSAPVRILVRELPGLSFVERELPPAYSPGVAFEVKLVATPPRLGSAWAVADQPPAGWSVKDISDDGVFDAVRGQVKFGPFTDLAARTLTYQVTPPSEAEGRYEFSGEAAWDGRVVPIRGDRTIEPATPTHPADLEPQDFAIGLAEVTAYAAAWKNGQSWPVPPVPIPLSYVTRAGQIWRQGEAYLYDPSQGPPPECWVPAKDGSGPGLRDGSPHRAARSLLGLARPGSAVEVRITVAPGDAVGAFAVEEQVPAGWAFVSAEGDATFDAAQRRLRWGPFYTATPRTLTYRVTPPADTASFVPLVGWASFDGRDQVIAGARAAVAEDADTAIGFRGIYREGAVVRFRLGGLPGQLCQIESSTDLSNWVPHHTVFVLEDGSVEFEDDAPAATARFFRVRPAVNP